MDAPGMDEMGLSSFQAVKAISAEIIPNTSTSAPAIFATTASIIEKTTQIKPIASSPITCHIAPSPNVPEMLLMSQPEKDMEKP
jgi:hypothetical protein